MIRAFRQGLARACHVGIADTNVEELREEGSCGKARKVHEESCRVAFGMRLPSPCNRGRTLGVAQSSGREMCSL